MLSRLMGTKPFTEFLLDALDNRQQYPQFINEENEFVLPRAAIVYGLPVEQASDGKVIHFNQYTFIQGNFTRVNAYDNQSSVRIVFVQCHFGSVDFSYSDLAQVKFLNTNFNGTNFYRSFLRAAYFGLTGSHSANFTSAQLLRSQHVINGSVSGGWQDTSYFDANLIFANMTVQGPVQLSANYALVRCNFTRANFYNFTTSGLNFVESTFDLRGSSFWSSSNDLKPETTGDIGQRTWFSNCTFTGYLGSLMMRSGVGFINCRFENLLVMDSNLNAVFDESAGSHQIYRDVRFDNVHGDDSFLIKNDSITNCDDEIDAYLFDHSVDLINSTFGYNPALCDRARSPDAATVGIATAALGVGLGLVCLFYLMYTRMQKHRDNSFVRGLTQTASNLFKRNEPAGVTPMGDLSHLSVAASERTSLLA